MANEQKEVSALTKTYDLILWNIPQLEKFLKSQRYLFGDRVEFVLRGGSWNNNIGFRCARTLTL